MDAREALSDLMEISSQVEAAVILDDAGETVAATPADERAGTALASAIRDLLAAADRIRSGAEAPGLVQLEVATRDGSAFVVREGGRVIGAATTPTPTVGLVFYDLKTCVRALDAPEPEAEEALEPAAGEAAVEKAAEPSAAAGADEEREQDAAP